jgi:membrane protein DedA with SNARE-associated domain
MSPELFLEKFGYLAVIVGTFLEGETILVLAGFFASRDYLSMPGVIASAFAGAFGGHLFWFWLGRTKGVKLLNQFPQTQKHFGRGVRLFERYGALAIVLSQYLYGLRISCAIVVGISRISALKFISYQALSCITWAALIAGLGYYFGRAVERVLGKAAHVEMYGLIVLLAVAGIVFIIHRRRDASATEVE